MSDQNPDLERSLTELFSLSQPRPGYETELWERLSSPRSTGDRFRGWAPLAAAAAALTVVAATGWLALGHVHTSPAVPAQAPAVTGPAPARTPDAGRQGGSGMMRPNTICGPGPSTGPTPSPSPPSTPCPAKP